jgi:hypothetical protein
VVPEVQLALQAAQPQMQAAVRLPQLWGQRMEQEQKSMQEERRLRRRGGMEART